MPAAIEEILTVRSPVVAIVALVLFAVAGGGIGCVLAAALIRWWRRRIQRKSDEEA